VNTPTPQLAGQPSEEFILRVNDFIEMANRLERRMDSAHAYMAFLYGFSRYGAHHYLNTVQQDSAQERDNYVQYMTTAVEQLLRHSIAEMKGELDAPAE
jgi:hypothetical protein